MENTSRLYDTLLTTMVKLVKWVDIRHLHTLSWMITGLILSEKISLTAWIPYVQGRAEFAQSTQRRFSRWLHNQKIMVNDLYGPIIQSALTEWGESRLCLALDTSMLWNRFCLIQISIIYRGRAIPFVWKVLEHKSSTVGFADYKELLETAQSRLPLHFRGEVLFLADRGFADTQLMDFLTHDLQWHWRIRIKSSFLVYRPKHRRCQVGHIKPKVGEAHFLHHVRLTAERFGPVHLALAHLRENDEQWMIASDQPTSVETFDEYGLRFDIEEGFLDEKSNGFQLESSLFRDADAISRLCFVLAVATLYLVSVGTDFTQNDNRRRVDPHWFRGNSYFRIGWQFVKHALSKAWALLSRFALSPLPDPEPSVSSRSQFLALPSIRLKVTFFRYAQPAFPV